MSISSSYLDRVKSEHNLENQNQLALFFGVSRQSMSQYYGGKRNFDIAMLLKVSKALDIHVQEIGIQLCIELAKTDDIRDYWKNEFENFKKDYV